jgi:hypothetical protein
MEWTNAYNQWSNSLPKPWSWNDPAVQASTAAFDSTALRVASELETLIAPNTPPDVAAAVRGAADAMVAMAASHARQTQPADTRAQEDAADKAMRAANSACGI